MTDKQPRTLADMTEEERQQCQGMWCDFHRGDDAPKEPKLGILGHWDKTRGAATIITPKEVYFWCAPENITPRPSLPRAWNPDGTRITADYEWCLVDENQHIHTETGQEHVPFPPGTGIHRWTTHWEAAQ